MKVLFITCWFPIQRNPNFGIFVKEHARSVQKAGGEVQIAHIWAEKSNAFYKTEVKQERDKSGVIINSKIIYSRFYKFFRYFWFLLYLPLWSMIKAKILPRFNPDCLHGNVIYPAGFLTYSLAKRLKKPYLLTEHWSKIESIFDSFLFKNRARKIFSEAESVHPVSEFLAKKMKKHISSYADIKVVPNVVDEHFTYKSQERKDDKTEFLCVMNHKQEKPVIKRPDLLIKAIMQLSPDKQENVRVRFIGPNQENSPVKNILQNNYIRSEVIFDGIRPKSYVARQMNRADYLAHPTEFETFGVVIAEALTSGLPCIVSDIPSLRELVNESNGRIVKENKPNAWGRVLENLLNNPCQFNRKEIAKKMGGEFSYKSVGNAYMKSYKGALQ